MMRQIRYVTAATAKGTDSLRLRLPPAMIQRDKARNEKKNVAKMLGYSAAGRPMRDYIMDLLVN